MGIAAPTVEIKSWHAFGIEMGHFPTHGMKSIHAKSHTSDSSCFQGAHRGRAQGCQQELSTREG